MADQPIADTQQQELLDQMMREEMRQQSHPQAKQWVALDNRALSLEEQVISREREIDRRRRGPGPAHLALEEARQDRDEHRQTPPGHDYKGGKNQWDQDYKELDEEVAQRDKAFGEALKKATPEELAKLQNDIEQKRATLVKTIEERQGIAMLPSERGYDDQQHQRRIEQPEQVSAMKQNAIPDHSVQQRNETAQSARDARQPELAREQPDEHKESDRQQVPQIDPYSTPSIEFADRVAQRRAVDQGDNQDQAVAGRRLRPNFAAYATTAEDLAFSRQLEDDQLTLHQQLGRRATHDELVKFAQDRIDAQSTTEQAQQLGSQPGRAPDLHAQVLHTTGSSMAERLAARRGQTNATGQGKGSEVKRDESSQQDEKPKRETDNSIGASTVAERESKRSEKAEAKAEVKAERAASQSGTRDRGDEFGQGM